MPSVRACKIAVLGLACCLILAAGILYFAAPLLLERAYVRAGSSAFVVAGQPLSLAGTKTVSLFPLTVSFSGLKLGDENTSGSVAVRSGTATVRFSSLFFGTPVFNEMTLDGAVFTYRGFPAPSSLTIGQAGTGQKTEDAADKSSMQNFGGASPLRIDRLVVRDGSMIIATDAGSNVRLTGITLSAYNLTEDGAKNIECDFLASMQTLLGEYKEANLAVRGDVRVADSKVAVSGLQVTATPLHGLFADSLGPVSLEGSCEYDRRNGSFILGQSRLGMQDVYGSVQGKGSLFAPVFFDGQAELYSKAKLRSQKDIFFSVPDSVLKGRILLDEKKWTMPSLEFQLGRLSGRGSLSFIVESGLLSIRGHTGFIDLNSLLNDFSCEVRPSKKGINTKKKDADETGYGLNMELFLEADKVRYNDIDFESVSLGLSGTRESIHIAPLQASFGEKGRLDAMVTVGIADKTWAYSAILTDFSLASLLRLVSSKAAMDGIVDARIQASSQGVSKAECLESVSGKGILNIHGLRCVQLEKLVDASLETSSLPEEENLGRVFLSFDLAQGAGSWSADFSGSSLYGHGAGSLDVARDKLSGSLELGVQEKTVSLEMTGTIKEPVFGRKNQ